MHFSAVKAQPPFVNTNTTIQLEKGKILLPLAQFSSIIPYGRQPDKCYDIFNPQLTFITHFPAEVRNSCWGTVLSKQEIEGAYLICIRSGDLVISYYGLSGCNFKKGDLVKPGAVLGRLSPNPDQENEYVLWYFFHYKDNPIDPWPWLRKETCATTESTLCL
jgi:hypothetical protein